MKIFVNEINKVQGNGRRLLEMLGLVEDARFVWENGECLHTSHQFRVPVLPEIIS
jgi:hypothetical protein